MLEQTEFNPIIDMNELYKVYLKWIEEGMDEDWWNTTLWDKRPKEQWHRDSNGAISVNFFSNEIFHSHKDDGWTVVAYPDQYDNETETYSYNVSVFKDITEEFEKYLKKEKVA